MDIFMFSAGWWEILIGALIQMAIPIALAYYVWKAPAVRQYFSHPTETNVHEGHDPPSN